ncbi:MAG: MotA/TolQ/ExbB proton channel family protein [Victivallaceae bacterium]|nr:MotA/TolQ/ExbB proton channel family protein [Victivallaceae bacterium]
MGSDIILNWKRLDPEARWGFKTKKFTAVTNCASFLLGALFTLVFYGLLYPFHRLYNWQMIDMFFSGGQEHRSTIPYYTMFLAFWCLAILLIKAKKLKVQKLALGLRLIPDDSTYTLSPMNAADVISKIREQVYRGEDFMLTCRLECALGNLRNIGRISDMSSIFNSLADNDASYVENSYILSRGLVWAIPILGFIGTVLGLSQAVGGFGSVVASGADLNMLTNALGGVTNGLAVAFETTLIALVAALLLQLCMTVIRQKEEDFLDECAAYCHMNVTSKLRMLDVRAEVAAEDSQPGI